MVSKHFKRICDRCETHFKPIGKSSKYCEKCRKKIQSENARKSDHSKMLNGIRKRKEIIKRLATKLKQEKSEIS